LFFLKLYHIVITLKIDATEPGALAYLKIADSIYDFISGNSDGL
jgi:hypothetical protein